jgi:hypothetical protein
VERRAIPGRLHLFDEVNGIITTKLKLARNDECRREPVQIASQG